MASRVSAVSWPSARRLVAPAVLVAVAAMVVDVIQWSGAAPLWVDEEMIALNIRERGFGELPGALWLGQGAPLGWLFVQRAILLTFGASEMSLRLVPLLFGLATVVATVWVGARWLTRPAAVLFVLLCAGGEWLSQYRFEVKHYSADALFALLLPALAVAVTETTDREGARARWVNWWTVASLAQWFAFGASLVTPACAVVLALAILARHGVRSAWHFAVTGLLWIASFGAHYLLSMKYTSNNAYLRTYWADHIAPAGLGLLATLGWIGNHLGQLAKDPGGTSLAITLWTCAACGFALATRPLLGGMFATVPLSAFLLAALGFVPLSGRLALWIVPAVYLGVALLFDRGVRSAVSAWRVRRRPQLAAAAIAIVASAVVSANVLARGWNSLDLGPQHSNRGVDDRRAVAWLMARHRPGDVIMSTKLGWPALWWYGNISIRRPIPGGYMRDGSLMYQVAHEYARPECRDQMQTALEKHERVLVHVGFVDMPAGFFDLLLHQLATFGTVVERGQFALSRTAVVELRRPDAAAPLEPAIDPPDTELLRGCVGVHTGRRW